MQQLTQTIQLDDIEPARARTIQCYANAVQSDGRHPLSAHRHDVLETEACYIRIRLTELLRNTPIGRGNEAHWTPVVDQVKREVSERRSADERILKKQINRLSPRACLWSTLNETEIRSEAENLARDYRINQGRFHSIVGKVSAASAAKYKNLVKTIRRRIRAQGRSYREAVALTIRTVSAKREKYISDGTLLDRRRQLHQQALWAECSVMVNIEKAISIPMKNLIDINGDRKNAEMIAMSEGINELAVRRDYAAIFVTLTAPPTFHPNPSHGVSQWDGSSPRDSHEFILKKWKKIRARHGKRGTDWLFMRTVEPHKDSAAHWHLMIWSTPAELIAVSADIQELFNWSDHACKIKNWNPEGPAKTSSYLMKYIHRATSRNAKRADAWRSAHGIRSFQTGGIPKSARTLWKLTREMSYEQIERHSWLTEAVTASRCGDFAKFVEALENDPITVNRESVYITPDKIEGQDEQEPVRSGSVITGVTHDSTGAFVKRQKGSWIIQTDPSAIAEKFRKLHLNIFTQGDTPKSEPPPPHGSDFVISEPPS